MSAQPRPTTEVSGDLTRTTRDYDWQKGVVSEIALRMPDGTTPIQITGYGYDSSLNVTSRTDRTVAASPRTESMTYDEQDRLTSWSESASTSLGYRWRVSYDMDDLGNLTDRKTSIPGSGGTAQLSQHIHYNYPTSAAARPDGVQTIEVPVAAPGLPSGVTDNFPGTFGYDVPRGTQLMRPRGETIDYTDFDLPTSFAKGTQTVTFRYDAGGQRAWKGENAGTGSEVSTKYLGDFYEKRRQGSGDTHVFYIAAGTRVVAQITRTSADPVSAAVDYLHADSLGSVVAVTGVSGAGAAVLGRKSYDPYGAQYDLAGVPYLTDASGEIAPGVHRGFTGHEMDYDVGLVNMRGRIYDTKTSRFASLDPLLSSPAADQAYNRYAYVGNNPFKYVDPTGYELSTVECNTANPSDCFTPVPTEPEQGNAWLLAAKDEFDALDRQVKQEEQKGSDTSSQTDGVGNNPDGSSADSVATKTQFPPSPERGPMSDSEKSGLNSIIAPAIKALAAYDKNPDDRKLRDEAINRGNHAIKDMAKAIGLSSKYSSRMSFDIDYSGGGIAPVSERHVYIGTNNFVLGLGLAALLVHESVHLWQESTDKLTPESFAAKQAFYENQASDMTVKYLSQLGFSPAELAGIPDHRM